MKTFSDEDVEVLEIGKLPFTLRKGKFDIKTTSMFKEDLNQQPFNYRIDKLLYTNVFWYISLISGEELEFYKLLESFNLKCYNGNSLIEYPLLVNPSGELLLVISESGVGYMKGYSGKGPYIRLFSNELNEKLLRKILFEKSLLKEN